MNKSKKMNEAKYFFCQMEKSLNVFDILEYNLSAFLCASRSILSYSYEEVKSNGNQNWYDDFVKSSSLIKYFKDKRDTNIHSFPVKTIQRHEFSRVLSLPLTKSIRTINKGEDTIESDKGKDIVEDSNKSEYKITILFKDWNGEEDVLELCKKYLYELECFLKVGVANGYIND